MKITKFGHCCLLIVENDLRILTDPGVFSSGHEELEQLDLVLITHEHQDHFHIDSVKKILSKNPNVKIITNHAVGELLQREGIASVCIEDGQSFEMSGVNIEGIGNDHAILYKTVPCHNTGYMIAGRLFYPGDALTIPHRDIDILALPVAGPWLKVADAIDYALAMKPKRAFAVHDGILVNPIIGTRIPSMILPENNIPFDVFEIGKEYDF